ncbi:hypothetical protein RISK_001466 [Rhodopirellula islandica]|uniref:Uncharacterized protein n=1 Tax=Rhodopirellula islandica TaxID=595434 RepID=A0A0J1BI84_RHOIS|nr:hypothetical protein RISK_001466 [Rhodopirellula islandica]
MESHHLPVRRRNPPAESSPDRFPPSSDRIPAKSPPRRTENT